MPYNVYVHTANDQQSSAISSYQLSLTCLLQQIAVQFRTILAGGIICKKRMDTESREAPSPHLPCLCSICCGNCNAFRLQRCSALEVHAFRRQPAHQAVRLNRHAHTGAGTGGQSVCVKRLLADSCAKANLCAPHTCVCADRLNRMIQRNSKTCLPFHR